MIKMEMDLEGFERSLNEAVEKEVQNVLEEQSRIARNIVCPTHGSQCSIDFARTGMPDSFTAHTCCDEGKRLLYEALGVTER